MILVNSPIFPRMKALLRRYQTVEMTWIACSQESPISPLQAERALHFSIMIAVKKTLKHVITSKSRFLRLRFRPLILVKFNFKSDFFFTLFSIGSSLEHVAYFYSMFLSQFPPPCQEDWFFMTCALTQHFITHKEAEILCLTYIVLGVMGV